MFLVFLFCLIIPINGVQDTEGVLGKLKSSLQLAGKLLGIDQASGVAQLVSDAFGKTSKKGETVESGNIFAAFLRILGFDSKKIGAIAVNAIIFMAQLISSSLARPIPAQVTQARRIQPGSPFDWMINSPQVTKMISHIKDEQLPTHLISYIKELSLNEETDCVQLLICKTSPFVWSMQKALSNTIKGPKALYDYFPTVKEVSGHGDECDKKHPFCFLDLY